MNSPTPLDHARDLLKRGFAPIPVPPKEKRCQLPGWPSLRLTEADLPHYFNGTRCNIGVLVGEPSRWIVDVDIDHERALALADSILPTTGMEWGRQSSPRSHRLYRVTSPVETKKWASASVGMLFELRSTGCQTIAPGSKHSGGEAVRWDADGEPTSIDPAALIAALEALANAVRVELGEGPGTTGDSAPRPVSPAPRGAASSYGREALRREAATVAGTPEGARNDALNRAAFNVGTLIGGGEVDRADAETDLLAAARSCGLPDAEARRTIASGIASGMKHPRQRPAQAGDTNFEGRTDTGEHITATPAPARAFAPIAASDLIREHPALRPVVIEGLLREGETMNIVAPPKIGKTWLVHSLILAVASVGEWLGKPTTRGRVLLIDGELHRETLAHRLHAVQRRLDVSQADMGAVDVWPVRGQRVDIDHIAAELIERPTGAYRLIVLDALYRFLPQDVEENSNEDMARVYNTLDAIGAQSGAALVVVHHSAKGSQAEKAVTEVGSGAGAQSRAADTHLILRPHETDGALVVDAAVRSFQPMEPFVIRSTRPGWEFAPDLDPAQLRGRNSRARRGAKQEAPARPLIAEMTPEEFARKFVGRHMSIKDDVLARAKKRGVCRGRAEPLLKRAEDAGLVHRHVDGPSSPHRFSIDPPANRMDTGRGGAVPPTPTPGASAPGGMGGTHAPPLPPSETEEANNDDEVPG